MHPVKSLVNCLSKAGDDTSKPLHAREIDHVMHALHATNEGLTLQEAQDRLKKYGYNELKEKKRTTPLQMFLGEFEDVFIILLLVATIFSVIIGYYELLRGTAESFLEAYTDAITIGIIVVTAGNFLAHWTSVFGHFL